MSQRDEELDHRIAELAHDCWVARMRNRGWTHGPYDPGSKTHDALVPFPELSRRDRRSADIAVQAEEVSEHLAELIHYDRGRAREFLIEDVFEGRRVAVESRPASIVRWSAEGEELIEIVVRFDDGEEASITPSDCLLERMDEDP